MIAGIFFAILFVIAMILTYRSFQDGDSARDRIEIIIVMIYAGIGSFVSFRHPGFASETWFTVVKYLFLAAILVIVFARRFEKSRP